ncbi:hypothetical protein [Mycolicibacterium alvei]|uniref:Uncharacterized protein n=1 Tax=Mycolicibacterium alvei TaxID=67081 RepID=A0A6N4UV54_9MYCO|nr:hypothetical protein [Mycolicibacterium alvei]MCV7002232.1 hypothetical protein [Mycolicibacterium alvei]BBX27421.1 hypothetical protein MALV_25460 [Mycolicibacterium alvei]
MTTNYNPWGWWDERGISHPQVPFPKKSLMLDGLLPLEQLLMEAIRVEAEQLGIPAEVLTQVYADGIEKVRQFDQERAQRRDEKNRELDGHLGELRENHRRRQGEAKARTANSEVSIVGPTGDREDRTLRLVQGDKVLGQLIYYNSTGTVVEVDPHEGPIHDRLVREAKARGLLHGKDIPDHLQHDQEHR